ncbi:hypothetical protein D9M70_534580 [compost metagenome]
MEVIRRGNDTQGLAWIPRSRRSSRMYSLSTMRKSRPNFSSISRRHFSCSEAGQTISTLRARWRSSISWMTRPASMVLPRPTSSAISRFTRAMSMARTRGSSWKSWMLTPLRNGAWRKPRSALVAAPQRTASRKASSVSESSCPVIAGRPARSMTCAPGSISQITRSSSPRASSSMEDRVTAC